MPMPACPQLCLGAAPDWKSFLAELFARASLWILPVTRAALACLAFAIFVTLRVPAVVSKPTSLPCELVCTTMSLAASLLAMRLVLFELSGSKALFGDMVRPTSFNFLTR